MARPCSICSDPRREAIDRALAEGVAFRDVARRFETDKSAVWRHARSHLRRELAAADEKRHAEDGNRAERLWRRLDEIRADAGRLLAKAERAEDFRAAVGAVRELRELFELEARLLGELRSGVAVGVAVNVEAPRVEVTPQTPREMLAEMQAVVRVMDELEANAKRRTLPERPDGEPAA